MARCHLVAASLALLVAACMSPPGGKITAEAAADPACGSELYGALDAMRNELGLGIDVGDDDAAALRDTGALEKSYGRDGARFTVAFGLDAGEGGACKLRMWSMTERRPGSVSTQSGNFGSIDLKVCRCQKGGG
ncbi:MAG: hypothetical protein H6711_25380 [Myxococcales bacterium]|nr:hypothetical protein [Myxococcales bacterium]